MDRNDWNSVVPLKRASCPFCAGEIIEQEGQNRNCARCGAYEIIDGNKARWCYVVLGSKYNLRDIEIKMGDNADNKE